jgi:hypothetical protein
LKGSLKILPQGCLTREFHLGAIGIRNHLKHHNEADAQYPSSAWCGMIYFYDAVSNEHIPWTKLYWECEICWDPYYHQCNNRTLVEEIQRRKIKRTMPMPWTQNMHPAAMYYR